MDIQVTSDSLKDYATAIVQQGGGLKSVRDLDWEKLKRINIFPGYAIGDGLFIVPEQWVPPGYQRGLAQRTLDTTIAGLVAQDATPTAAGLRSEWIGRAVLSFWLPTGSIRGGGLQTWSFRSRVLMFLRMIRTCLNDMTGEDWDFWPFILKLESNDFVAVTASSRGRSDLRCIAEILKSSAQTGVMPPLPKATPIDRSEIEDGYSDIQPHPQHRTRKATTSRDKPFPNEFVVEFLSHGFWIQDNIADAVIDVWQRVIAIDDEGEPESHRMRSMRAHVFREWRNEQENLIRELPFPIRQCCGNNRFEDSVRWPPEHYKTIPLLVTVIQAVNVSTVAFCTAARTHEIQGMEPSNIQSTVEQTIRSKTYKNQRRRRGRERDWPLHERAAKALATQERLANVIRIDGQQHLWVKLTEGSNGPQGGVLANLSQACASAIKQMCISLESGNPNLHRWRHTVARVVGLTVDRAPEVLMDLFGSDFDGILAYLLSDPEIASEAIRVAEEATYALAAEVISEIQDGKTSGNATISIRRGLRAMAMKRGIDELGTDDIMEAAAILVASGVGFQIVRRGVICVKQPGEYGPCTRTTGRPDKGSCRAECPHRLETEREKAQCREQVAAVLDLLQASINSGEIMLAEHLKGQLIHELYRWNEVRSEFLSASTLARQVWASA